MLGAAAPLPEDVVAGGRADGLGAWFGWADEPAAEPAVASEPAGPGVMTAPLAAPPLLVWSGEAVAPADPAPEVVLAATEVSAPAVLRLPLWCKRAL